MSKHVDGRHPLGNVRLTRVETTHLAEVGLTLRWFVFGPTTGALLVAKIDSLANLEGEMLRFNQFLAWWDNALRPRIHFHAGTGLILFLSSKPPDAPGNPLPHLRTASVARIDERTA